MLNQDFFFRQHQLIVGWKEEWEILLLRSRKWDSSLKIEAEREREWEESREIVLINRWMRKLWWIRKFLQCSSQLISSLDYYYSTSSWSIVRDKSRWTLTIFRNFFFNRLSVSFFRLLSLVSEKDFFVFNL